MRDIETYQAITDPAEEEIVLGSVLTNRSAFVLVSSIVTEEAFSLPLHRAIWAACKDISARGQMIDLISVRQRLTASKTEFNLATLAAVASNATPFEDELEFHARHLADLAVRRSFLTIATKLAVASTNEAEEVEKIISDSINDLSSTGPSDDGVRTMEENLRLVNDTMLENMDPDRQIGIQTGFSEYDRKTGGLFVSDFVLIAADSSQGKTSFVLRLALSAAQGGSAVAIFSLEMTGQQLTARLLSMVTGVPSDRILRHHLDIEEYQRASSGINALMNLPIYTDDKSTSMIDGIIASIRSRVIREKIKVAVIDFLQILSTNQRTINQDAFLGEVCRKLKNLAKDLQICVIALSQLNRDKEDPVPTIARLRGSGQMNEAADLTILLYRPEYYIRRYPDKYRNLKYPEPYQNADPRGTALVKIAKSRNSRPFDMLVGFDDNTTRFFDLPEGRIPEISAQSANYTEPDPF